MSTSISVNSARKIAEATVYLSFLSLFGKWISPLGAFDTWVASTSGEISGLHVLLTDFFAVAGVMALGIAFWEQRPRRIQRFHSKFQAIAVILLVLAGVSAVSTGIINGNENPYAEGRLFAYGATALLMPWIFNSRAALHRIVGLLIAVPVLVVLTNHDFHEVIITAKTRPWQAPMVQLLMSASLALGIGIAAGSSSRVRKLVLLCFAVSAIAVFMNIQRGGYIGFIFGVSTIATVYLFGCLSRKDKRSLLKSATVLLRHKPWSVLPVAAVTIGLLVLSFTLAGTILDTASERFSQLRSPRDYPSLAYRLDATEAGFNWWKESPLFGKGAGFKTVWDVPYRPPGHPFKGQTEFREASLHNFFLRVLLFSGTIGAGAVLFALVWATTRLISSLRTRDGGQPPIVLGCFGMLSAGILAIAPSPTGSDNMLLLWLVVGIAILPWSLSGPDGIISNRVESV